MTTVVAVRKGGQVVMAADSLVTFGDTRLSYNAEANRKLSSSVSNDPNVLVSRCFDILSEMVASKEPVPAGFTCWPGGGSGIVLPSAGQSPSRDADR